MSNADLYHEAILDHYRRPHGRGSLPEPDVQATRTNALCGETMHVDVTLDEDRVRDIRFDGDACAIARASASMMTDLVRGRSRAEIEQFITKLKQFVTASPSAPDDSALGPLVALGIVRRTPARVSCALLAWETLSEALAQTLSLELS
ncbi:MAG TPA: SUF system NifU family Fe-S cluster assembly protein [Gemmatimonadaceae bacterium]|nr:SUF system NifU family Fe-S cluster assembly protein [Gemmatimonadaceae bacterium]